MAVCTPGCVIASHTISHNLTLNLRLISSSPACISHNLRPAPQVSDHLERERVEHGDELQLQPYVLRTATPCARGCNPMCARLQPYVNPMHLRRRAAARARQLHGPAAGYGCRLTRTRTLALTLTLTLTLILTLALTLTPTLALTLTLTLTRCRDGRGPGRAGGGAARRCGTARGDPARGAGNPHLNSNPNLNPNPNPSPEPSPNPTPPLTLALALALPPTLPRRSYAARSSRWHSSPP